MARRLAAQESGESEEVDSAKEPQFSVLKQKSVVENVKELVVTEAESKEHGFLSGSSLPAHGSILTNKLPPESTDQGDDLFESEDLFASRSMSRTATQSKLREELPDSVANEPVKGMEKKPELSVLGNQDSTDLFQSVQQKSSSKNSPISFLEEEEDFLFTSQKTGKKELKSAVRQAVDSAAQDIFEVMAETCWKELGRKACCLSLFDPQGLICKYFYLNTGWVESAVGRGLCRTVNEVSVVLCYWATETLTLGAHLFISKCGLKGEALTQTRQGNECAVTIYLWLLPFLD